MAKSQTYRLHVCRLEDGSETFDVSIGETDTRNRTLEKVRIHCYDQDHANRLMQSLQEAGMDRLADHNFEI